MLGEAGGPSTPYESTGTCEKPMLLMTFASIPHPGSVPSRHLVLLQLMAPQRPPESVIPTWKMLFALISAGTLDGVYPPSPFSPFAWICRIMVCPLQGRGVTTAAEVTEPPPPSMWSPTYHTPDYAHITEERLHKSGTYPRVEFWRTYQRGERIPYGKTKKELVSPPCRSSSLSSSAQHSSETAPCRLITHQVKESINCNNASPFTVPMLF